MLELVVIHLLIFLGTCWAVGGDLRSSIVAGREKCFNYVQPEGLIQLTCSRLEWTASNYSSYSFITLESNEIFDGNSNIIDLSGVTNFLGLFAVSRFLQSFDDAPIVRNVRVEGGKTATFGGFLVRQQQRFFIIDSCSSTGTISRGGGICGQESGHNNGQIKILNSHSSGPIEGSGGGIAGERLGFNGGIVNISNCFSTGKIDGGGISGFGTGRDRGQVYIERSYSTGEIAGTEAGGIVGSHAAFVGGLVFIQQCYSSGEILGRRSGGISGASTGESEGQVCIVNSYSNGTIKGRGSAGICGGTTGGRGGTVLIRSSYASGYTRAGASRGTDSGGIIAKISDGALTVTITCSLSGAPLVESNADKLSVNSTGNSNNLDNVRGKLYQCDSTRQWSESAWTPTDGLPRLRFELGQTFLDTAATVSPSPLPLQTPFFPSGLSFPTAVPSPFGGIDEGNLPQPKRRRFLTVPTTRCTSRKHGIKVVLVI
eukprot:gb/GECG01008420.1/.p1 GENE.gb/GECG01008420.1/~~gb/GECG01008420.1/.p1  ORF type:complete len:485 (+),score=28.42 gb/GECG01008420.1/:1-1455(+)